ncbi:MAG: DUF488 family protein [Acidobacteria bacterium]|nr:DUF488 family protein [Acidobacteriota bacterium]
MITTSNFAKSGSHPDGVAISRGVPRFYKGRRYLALAPPSRLLKAKDPELFNGEYRKQLADLDARQVAEDLGPNAILLCWESFNVRCHRRLVAEWLEEKLGIVVPELGHERSESIPYISQPSKWDAAPHAPKQVTLF